MCWGHIMKCFIPCTTHDVINGRPLGFWIWQVMIPMYFNCNYNKLYFRSSWAATASTARTVNRWRPIGPWAAKTTADPSAQLRAIGVWNEFWEKLFSLGHFLALIYDVIQSLLCQNRYAKTKDCYEMTSHVFVHCLCCRRDKAFLITLTEW